MSAACRLRDAYIQIAILGTSFCTSAKKVGNSALYVYNEVLFAFEAGFLPDLKQRLAIWSCCSSGYGDKRHWAPRLCTTVTPCAEQD